MSKPMTLPMRHSFTMRIDRHVLVRLQEKAFRQSMEKMEPISASDLILRALEKAYPEIFKV